MPWTPLLTKELNLHLSTPRPPTLHTPTISTDPLVSVRRCSRRPGSRCASFLRSCRQVFCSCCISTVLPRYRLPCPPRPRHAVMVMHDRLGTARIATFLHIQVRSTALSVQMGERSQSQAAIELLAAALAVPQDQLERPQACSCKETSNAETSANERLNSSVAQGSEAKEDSSDSTSADQATCVKLAELLYTRLPLHQPGVDIASMTLLCQLLARAVAPPNRCYSPRMAAKPCTLHQALPPCVAEAMYRCSLHSSAAFSAKVLMLLPSCKPPHCRHCAWSAKLVSGPRAVPDQCHDWGTGRPHASFWLSRQQAPQSSQTR